jgi:hypothetical protein
MAASPASARALADCLECDRDVRRLAGATGAAGTGSSASTEAILDLALGQRRGNVAAQIARSAGIDPVQADAILACAASLLLGALSDARRRSAWSEDDLRRTLAVELTLAEDAVPGSVGVLEELLEAAPDADLGEDVAEVGTQLLARLRES